MRVLIVEDDEELGALFAQILAERGHDVFVASDVAAAIARLSAAPTDVVVTDVRLPGTATGLDLLAWLQRSQPKVAAVLASAFTTQDLAAAAKRLGARSVLSKPIEPAALVVAVEAA